VVDLARVPRSGGEVPGGDRGHLPADGGRHDRLPGGGGGEYGPVGPGEGEGQGCGQWVGREKVRSVGGRRRGLVSMSERVSQGRGERGEEPEG